MSYKENLSTLFKAPLILTSVALLSLTGCGSSSDGSSTGYFQLYNSSSTAPAIYLTVDKYKDDDYTETTHTGISYTNVSSRFEYKSDNYDIELAWKDEDYDLEIIYEENLKLRTDKMKFIVVAEDISAPNILIYDIDMRKDNEKDDDSDDELFNLRFLNLYNASSNFDVYFSESDETFNEAILIAQPSYTELTDMEKYDQEEYVFYITEAGSDEIIYTSEEISFPYASEYIMVIRENKGAGDSPIVLDKVSTSSVTEYADANSETEFRIYNGIIEHELLPTYLGEVDLHIDGIDDTPEVANLAYGQFSDLMATKFKDYSMNLLASGDSSSILENHLLTLDKNSNKTVFYYLTEENVDRDGDGDVDEDRDGEVDEVEIFINSLVVDNSVSESVYTHNIKIINLIDTDDFTAASFNSVSVYFVKSDEIIDTAENAVAASYITPTSITLNNNTYNVYVIAKIDSSDHIISSSELILNEDSKDQFLLVEADESTSTGYKMSFSNQNVDVE